MQMIAQEMMSLLEFLKCKYPESSNNTLRSWIENGRVLVDDRVIKHARHPVKKEDRVTVGQKVQFLPQEMRLLFEDRDLIVIYKPEGLLSVATDSGLQTNAHALLKKRADKKVFPVHRLDRDTSGVMVFAYTEKARAGLKRQFHQHTIKREYVALVEGTLAQKAGTWESLLLEDSAYKVFSSSSGKRSVTHFEVIGQRPGYTLMLFRLETGRKNQIRVHAHDAGHPIAGDIKYGAKTNPHKRLCLHAQKLGFIHPVTSKPLCFEVPPPSWL